VKGRGMVGQGVWGEKERGEKGAEKIKERERNWKEIQGKEKGRNCARRKERRREEIPR